MTKDEFIRILNNALADMDAGRREDLLNDIRTHFTDAQALGFREEEIAQRLGNPEELAAQILEGEKESGAAGAEKEENREDRNSDAADSLDSLVRGVTDQASRLVDRISKAVSGLGIDFLFGRAREEEPLQTFTRSFEGMAESVEVRLGKPNLEIRAGEKITVQAEGLPEDELTLACENGVLRVIQKPNPTVSRREQHITVTLPEAPVSAQISSGSGNQDIRLPALKSLNANSGSGDISVEADTAADFTANTGSGDILLCVKELAGSCRMRSGSGDCTLKTEKAGSIVVNTASGDQEITCGEAEGSVSLASSSGDITLRASAGEEITVSTASGDIEMKCENTRVISATASSGDISLRGGAPEKLSLVSTSGDITAVLSHGELYAVQMNTASGSLELDTGDSCLREERRLQWGTGTQTVRATTVSGAARISFQA